MVMDRGFEVTMSRATRSPEVNVEYKFVNGIEEITFIAGLFGWSRG